MFPATEEVRTKDELISHYFSLNLSYSEIVNALLLHHGLKLSLRHLHRLLKKMGLRRLRPGGIQESAEADIKEAIMYELRGSGQCLGYRAMWHRLKHKYRLIVKRNTVSKYMWELDPEGVSCRKAKRMKRRKYVSPGPNFTWHLDGYDKKPTHGK